MLIALNNWKKNQINDYFSSGRVSHDCLFDLLIGIVVSHAIKSRIDYMSISFISIKIKNKIEYKNHTRTCLILFN